MKKESDKDKKATGKDKANTSASACLKFLNLNSRYSAVAPRSSCQPGISAMRLSAVFLSMGGVPDLQGMQLRAVWVIM